MNVLATVEFEPNLYQGLTELAKTKSLTFSDAMNHILNLGMQVAQGELTLPDEMTIAQKMLLQATIETWLITKTIHDKAIPQDIAMQAKELIRNTLAKTED